MASQIDIQCPYCKGKMTIESEGGGQTGECPYCNREFELSDSVQDKLTPATPRLRNKFAGKSSFRESSVTRKFFVLGIAVGIAGVLLIVSLIVLGFVFLRDSNSIKDGGHRGVQLWEDGPYWAETNVGAEKPWDYGYYFWWGGKVGYKHEGNAWIASNGSSSNFKFDETSGLTWKKTIATLYREGWTREDGVLLPEHDAAHVHWGGKWRMPTKREFEDLNSKCDWTWTPMNGVNGYVVRGRGDYASASIFLPAACAGLGTSLYYAGSYGVYWSSVPYLFSYYGDYYAWGLYFSSDYHSTDSYDRYSGQSVRPVQRFTK